MISSVAPQTAADEPAGTRGRVPAAVVGAVVLLIVVLGGYWLLTAHLSTDRTPARAGAAPGGCTITLPSGAGPSPDDRAGSCLDTVTITNDGVLPVTVSAPLPATLIGPGKVVSGLHRFGSVGVPAIESLRLEPGDRLTVSLETVVPACAAPGETGTGRTVVDGLRLTVAVGPLTRDVVLPLEQVTEVLPADGTTLPRCSE
ncbi:MAG: hypothetical protein KQH57_15155 [Actinomycetales bacterium]|nr:hypothetical protein [Actinomycetales bacterium]